MADDGKRTNPYQMTPEEVIAVTDPDAENEYLPQGDQTNVVVDGVRLIPQNNPWDNPGGNATTGGLYEGTAKALTNTLNSKSWISQLRSKSPSQYEELVGYLRAANMISDRTVDPGANTVADATRALLTEAGAAGQEFYAYVKGRYGDPIFLEKNGLDGASGPSGGFGRAPRMPSRTEQVDRINDMRAPSILNAAMQEAIGRNATKKEVDAFVKLVNSEAENNPRFQQNTPVGLTNTDIETGGGIDTNYLAEQFAGRTPGAKEYRLNEAANVIEDLFAEQIGLF